MKIIFIKLNKIIFITLTANSTSTFQLHAERATDLPEFEPHHEDSFFQKLNFLLYLSLFHLNTHLAKNTSIEETILHVKTKTKTQIVLSDFSYALCIL